MSRVASYPGLLPPPRAHAPYVMRRWFFGGRRPGYEAMSRVYTLNLLINLFMSIHAMRPQCMQYLPGGERQGSHAMVFAE